MPSVLWYPLGIMVFGVTSKAIILMMILGAAPAVANGFISGIDQVPPDCSGSGGSSAPGALPRASRGPAGRLPEHPRRDEAGLGIRLARTMAGEFLILVNPLSLGGRTVNAVAQGEWAVVVSMMIVIVFIGIMVDVAFSSRPIRAPEIRAD